MKRFLLGWLCCLPILLQAQQVSTVTTLNAAIAETSGLIQLDGKFITHNDSGDEPTLYEIDTLTGSIDRVVLVRSANNVDWEDICKDDTYIYIADIGNNNGSRTDLKVYRIKIEDYQNYDTVTAETIAFNYSDQTNFTPAPLNTNFDAEAIIAYNDSLYIFTKNWINNRTNIYALSKLPGTYSIEKVDDFWANGLVTGADYNPETGIVILSGYSLIFPFIIEIENIEGHAFSAADRKRYNISVNQSVQIESIVAINYFQYYMTAEAGTGGSAALYRLNTDQVLSDVNHLLPEQNFYPNPSSNIIKIEGEDSIKVLIYDNNGGLMMVTTEHEIDVSTLDKGLYFVTIMTNDSNDAVVRKLVVE